MRKLFSQYKNLPIQEYEKKQAIADSLIRMAIVHNSAETEIIYPNLLELKNVPLSVAPDEYKKIFEREEQTQGFTKEQLSDVANEGPRALYEEAYDDDEEMQQLIYRVQDRSVVSKDYEMDFFEAFDKVFKHMEWEEKEVIPRLEKNINEEKSIKMAEGW